MRERTGLLATAGRFLLSGAANTALTYGLYLVLLPFSGYAASYSLAFAAGIALAYFLGRVFVFRGGRPSRRHLLFPAVYLFQYGAGLAVVVAWVELLGLGAKLAPLGAIAVTVPTTFVLSRWVFGAPHPKTPK